MKVVFADFRIEKYGGIVEYVCAMCKAFRDLGCDVDIVQFHPNSMSQSAYDKKIREIESGEFQKKLKPASHAFGFERDNVTGYWKNNYEGFFLPPSNRINVFSKDALSVWNNYAKDVDVILWNFLPTKNKSWDKNGEGGFGFWWKFLDLPSSIKQVFLVHDAYFNVRASQMSALRDKILFLGCAHIAAYKCCEEFKIPRLLLLNPRYIEDKKMHCTSKSKRVVDFFAAHMFKSMKHMEDLVKCVPYLDRKYNVMVAGGGIEWCYMTSDKVSSKPRYVCSKKTDPDLPKELDGKKIPIWQRAVEYGMEYVGQISGEEVFTVLKNCKFAIDPSWSEHYAQYCRTHINGFIIEAMMYGAYPVLRDYRGLAKGYENVYDPLFENVKAIMIPWDATPKQFAESLKKAMCMSEEQYLEDTRHNFELVKSIFNANGNAKEIIRLCNGGRKLVAKELECGEDSKTVKKITEETMQHFGVQLPIKWTTY